MTTYLLIIFVWGYGFNGSLSVARFDSSTQCHAAGEKVAAFYAAKTRSAASWACEEIPA